MFWAQGGELVDASGKPLKGKAKGARASASRETEQQATRAKRGEPVAADGEGLWG